MKTKPDINRLRRVLAHIDGNPESWDQNVIARKTECGTACCIAGHAVALEGRQFLFGNAGYSYSTTGGENVWCLAAELLGLDCHETEDLFAKNNNRQDIQRIAEQIALRAGETL